jgi:hypothetical protein
MSALGEALRRKYRTPGAALRQLGLDEDLLDDIEGRDNHMPPRFTRARRMGRDEEEADNLQEIKDMLSDGDLDYGDLIAAAVEYCPENRREELHRALGEMGEDSRQGRSHRSWARDRLERRRLGHDVRGARRLGRDDPEPFPGRPRPGGTMDPIAGDRRRMAGDAAIGSSPDAMFRRLYPNASPIDRF